MAYIIIKALVPIFIIMLLGFFSGKRGIIDNKNISSLNIFVMDFAIPTALFSATVITPWYEIVQQWYLIVVLSIGMWIIFTTIYFICTKVFKKSAKESAVLALTVSLPNYAALGLPILGGVFGDNTTVSLSVAISITSGSVLLAPIGLLVLEREKAKENNTAIGSTLSMLPILLWRSITNPIVCGPLIGVILSAMNIKIPDIILIGIKPLGLAATAAALFLTGLILSTRKLKLNFVVSVFCITKLIIQPFLAWGIILLLGLHGRLAITSILMLSLSAGFFGVVFGNSFGVQSPDAEAILLISSILCIVSLPLFITLTL